MVEQIRAWAATPLLEEAWHDLAQQRLLLAEKEAEARTLDQELARLACRLWQGQPGRSAWPLQAPTRLAKERQATLRQEINALKRAPGSDSDRLQTLATLAETEDATPTAEQTQLVHLLVSRVDYDGQQGKVTITFQPLGLETLANARLATAERGTSMSTA